jgi:hypothetical protein
LADELVELVPVDAAGGEVEGCGRVDAELEEALRAPRDELFVVGAEGGRDGVAG